MLSLWYCYNLLESFWNFVLSHSFLHVRQLQWQFRVVSLNQLQTGERNVLYASTKITERSTTAYQHVSDDRRSDYKHRRWVPCRGGGRRQAVRADSRKSVLRHGSRSRAGRPTTFHGVSRWAIQLHGMLGRRWMIIQLRSYWRVCHPHFPILGIYYLAVAFQMRGVRGITGHNLCYFWPGLMTQEFWGVEQAWDLGVAPRIDHMSLPCTNTSAKMINSPPMVTEAD